jgi:hypothetical protein
MAMLAHCHALLILLSFAGVDIISATFHIMAVWPVN